MELRLSLGDSSSLEPFMHVAQESISKVPDLRIHMGLSLDIGKPSCGETIKDETPLLFSSDLAKYRDDHVGNKRSLVEGDERGSDSKSSDEDANGHTRKKLRLSKQQSAFLEQSFKEHSSSLNPKQKLGLAKQLNLRPRQVEVWFQNRRARRKLKQTEVDCEHLKTYFETLTKENRMLHKELQELRALKTWSSFYKQSPATTLTTCTSCHERVATSTPSTTVIATKPTTGDPSFSHVISI